jgi:hypothetical protein
MIIEELIHYSPFTVLIKSILSHNNLLLSEPPRKRLPQHRLRQRLRPLRGRRNLAFDGIRTGEECPDTDPSKNNLSLLSFSKPISNPFDFIPNKDETNY